MAALTDVPTTIDDEVAVAASVRVGVGVVSVIFLFFVVCVCVGVCLFRPRALHLRIIQDRELRQNGERRGEER